ncbi:MAG: hypothetical protein H6577_10640 [Lewinellaceae bacterium]|nr:hypothetical protein [Lewinellaceae bacterium]
MQNAFKHLLIMALLAAQAVTSFAQQKTEDTVYMRNGETHKGEITRYVQGETLLLRQADSTLLELKDSDIRKIVQGTEYVSEPEVSEPSRSKAGDAKLRSKGFYNTTALSFAIGNSDSDGLILGAGLGNVTGYQLASWLGIGVGIGVDNYATRGETIYPLFGELRSYFPSKKGYGYYLALAGGYGLAFKRQSLDIVEAKGGLMVHPAAGVRIATVEGLDLNIDIGFKYQEASFTRNLYDGDVQTRNLTYQRIVLRAGLTLWK